MQLQQTGPVTVPVPQKVVVWEAFDVSDPSKPTLLTKVISGLTTTHKNWWECDTGIAYLVSYRKDEGWRSRGVKIYDQQELDPPTGAAGRLGEAATGPIMLQEHGMPAQFRNVWVVEQSAGPSR